MSATSAGDRRAYRQLLGHLVARDLRVRYKRSMLGVLWALLEPLSMMALFTLVMGHVLKVPVANYPIFVLVGLIAWGFFQSSLTHAMSSFAVNAPLIRKIYFPREVIPFASVLGRFVHYCVATILLLAFAGVWGITPTIHVVALPLLMGILLVLGLGAGLLVAGLSALYDDVSYLATFALSAAFYATPVLYPTSLVPSWLRTWFLLNPMACLLDAMRAVVLEGTWPEWSLVGWAAAMAVALLAIAVWSFRRLEWQLAEVL